MANFDLTDLAVRMLCPSNKVKIDDSGLPSVLVYIPKFKNSDVLTGGNDSTHPAFIVNGKEIDGFWYGKYQCTSYNGIGYSLPFETPATYVTFEKAYSNCYNKGDGWHVSTNAEWAAIALWCKKNGFLPYGNNNYGKDTRESNYKAVPVSYESDGRRAKVATGSGPVSWSHDNTIEGVYDLNGNVWEWQAGIRFVWGELQILANNDACDPDNPLNETSTLWRAINASDGALVAPESTIDAASLSGSTLKLDFADSKWTYGTSIADASNVSRNCLFGDLACTSAVSDNAKILLRSLALLPDSDTATEDYEGDSFFLNNGVAERFVCRGGSWGSGAHAGVFSLHGSHSRAISSGGVGFRCAYVEI